MLNNTTDGNCITADELGRWFDYTIVALYIIVILISICGNSALCLVVLTNSSMRTLTNLLICNCSLADLLNTIIPTIWEVVDTLKFRGHWPLGPFMCVVKDMSTYLSVAASINTLIIISIDRFLAIISPYKKYMKKRHLMFILPIIWSAAFLFASPTIFTSKVTPEEEHVDHHHKETHYVCREKWPASLDPENSGQHYTIILFVFLYVLPLMLMSTLYMIIIRKLSEVSFKQTIKRNDEEDVNILNDEESPTSGGDTTNRKSPFCHRKQQIRKPIRKTVGFPKNRIIKMLILIVIVFAVCWFPVFLLQFLLFFDPGFSKCPYMMPRWMYSVAFFMQYANSAIRPMIYFGFSDSYRKSFISTFKPLFAVKRREESNGDGALVVNDVLKDKRGTEESCLC